jgi:hypothetical protein
MMAKATRAEALAAVYKLHPRMGSERANEMATACVSRMRRWVTV